MTTETQLSQFQQFVGQKVDLTLAGQTWHGVSLKFAGVNAMGGKVVTCFNGWIFHLDSWEGVEMVTSNPLPIIGESSRDPNWFD